MRQRELQFEVSGFPPIKNEAKSLFSMNHGQSDEVTRLLEAAFNAVNSSEFELFGAGEPVRMEVIIRCPGVPLADATNMLGGIGDVLQDKTRQVRGVLDPVPLADFYVYPDDRQICEIHYRLEQAIMIGYAVRLWR